MLRITVYSRCTDARCQEHCLTACRQCTDTGLRVQLREEYQVRTTVSSPQRYNWIIWTFHEKCLGPKYSSACTQVLVPKSMLKTLEQQNQTFIQESVHYRKQCTFQEAVYIPGSSVHYRKQCTFQEAVSIPGCGIHSRKQCTAVPGCL